MKVLPLIFLLLILLSLYVREELSIYKLERMGRISYMKAFVDFRLASFAAFGERPPSPPPAAQAPGGEPVRRGPALSRELNLWPLFDPTLYADDPERREFTERVVERLFEDHFLLSPLYHELKERDPGLISHLFQALRERFREIKREFGEVRWNHLALITLGESDLQALLYEVIKGERIPLEMVDQAFREGRRVPLLNSLKVQSSLRPIRLFLASPALLRALAGREIDLETLLEKRRELARALRRKGADRVALSKEWEETLKRSGVDLPARFANYELTLSISIYS